MVSICAIERGCEICYDSVEWEDALGNDKAMGMEISYILFKKCSNLNETHLPQEAYIVNKHHKKFHLEIISTGPRNSISNLPISHGFKLWNRWNCSASWHKTSLYSANRNDNKVTNYEMRIIPTSEKVKIGFANSSFPESEKGEVVRCVSSVRPEKVAKKFE